MKTKENILSSVIGLQMDMRKIVDYNHELNTHDTYQIYKIVCDKISGSTIPKLQSNNINNKPEELPFTAFVVQQAWHKILCSGIKMNKK